MDKGSQPNMWGNYDVRKVDQEAFGRYECERRIREIREVIGSPDAEEQIILSRIGMREGLVDVLDLQLSLKFSRSFGGNYRHSKDVATAKLFDSHETVSGDNGGFAMEYHTSVVALDLFDENAENMKKVADVLLFRLSASMPGEPKPKTTAENMVWGSDCAFGALITDSGIKWFKLGVTGGEIVEGEVRREDITEESGEKVAMRIIRNQRPGNEIQFIDPHESSDLASELNEELDKFIASRRPSQ